MINAVAIKDGLKNSLIKTIEKTVLPHPPTLFPLHFTGVFVGNTSSGKTNAAVQLARAYVNNKSFNYVFVLSPTADQNPVFGELGEPGVSLFVFDGEKVLTNPIGMLKKVLRKVRKIKKEYDENEQYKKIWRHYKRGTANMEEVNYVKFRQHEPPLNLPFPSPLVIIDDLSHSALYQPSSSNPFVNLLLRHRHIYDVGISIFMLVQTFKTGVPRAIRLNIRIFFIWKTDTNQLKSMFEEMLGEFTFEQFEKVYHTATTKRHDFLTIDRFTKHREKTFRKNFDEYLIVK
jgi:hypothetical protein